MRALAAGSRVTDTVTGRTGVIRDLERFTWDARAYVPVHWDTEGLGVEWVPADELARTPQHSTGWRTFRTVYDKRVPRIPIPGRHHPAAPTGTVADTLHRKGAA